MSLLKRKGGAPSFFGTVQARVKLGAVFERALRQNLYSAFLSSTARRRGGDQGGKRCGPAESQVAQHACYWCGWLSREADRPGNPASPCTARPLRCERATGTARRVCSRRPFSHVSWSPDLCQKFDAVHGTLKATRSGGAEGDRFDGYCKRWEGKHRETQNFESDEGLGGRVAGCYATSSKPVLCAGFLIPSGIAHPGV